MLHLIKSVLEPAQLKPKYEDVLLERMDLYEMCFTSSSVDKKNNYEYYETLGDATVNKFIVWYFYRRFPQLHCPEGVKVISRLKINYVSKTVFAQVADKLGFWPFIKAADNKKLASKESLLEDVFEAFMGVTEDILDNRFMVGVGYAKVHDILKSIFDKLDISLEYEDLFDPKSRLKELFDRHKQLGRVDWVDKDHENIVYMYHIGGGQEILGRASGNIKKEREQKASQIALDLLSERGITYRQNYNIVCE